MTSENGKSARLVVSALGPPGGTLTVRATSSDPSEATVSGPLHFDVSNWQVPQELVVTGEDDGEADGNVTYQITVEAERDAFGLFQSSVEVFSFVNLDDEIARFSGLGDLPGGVVASYASAVSAAGDVIVGWSGSASGDEAFRWTWDTGIGGLGGDQSRANDVSPNGQVIVGSVAEASYELGRAATIWRTGSPIQVVAPYGPRGSILFYPVDGTVALDSGDLFGACIQRRAYGERLICRVGAGGEFDTFGAGDAFAADDAGHVVGARYADAHAAGVFGPRAYVSGLLSARLLFPTTPECVIPNQCAARARAFSTDPVTIVGTALVPRVGQTTRMGAPLINVAFAVTAGAGVTRLEDLPGDDESSGALAIDASGRVIGGFGTNDEGRRATVWVARSPRLLTDIAASAGIEIPDGWILSEVRAMSDDGRTLVGNGTNPAGEPEGFVVLLPSAL